MNANGHIELIDFDAATCFNIELYNKLENINNTGINTNSTKYTNNNNINNNIYDDGSFSKSTGTCTGSSLKYTLSRSNSINITTSSSSIDIQYNKYMDRKYTFVGTLGYMAPEIVKYQYQSVSSRLGYSYMADWYSVGVTIYKLLFQDSPYKLDDDPNNTYYNRNTHLQYVNITQNMKILSKEHNIEHNIEYNTNTSTNMNLKSKVIQIKQISSLLSELLDINPESRLGHIFSPVQSHILFNNIQGTYSIPDWNEDILYNTVPPSPPKIPTKYTHLKTFQYDDFEDMEMEMAISVEKYEDNIWCAHNTSLIKHWDYNT